MERKEPIIDIRIIPPMTVDEEAFLLRERGITPWCRMTRAEIEEKYPGLLKGPSR
jgi:hypothetical protein